MKQNGLIAKSARQVDLALKIIHENSVQFIITFEELDSGKLIYHLWLDVDDETFKRIERSYKNFVL